MKIDKRLSTVGGKELCPWTTLGRHPRPVTSSCSVFATVRLLWQILDLPLLAISTDPAGGSGIGTLNTYL